MSTEDTISRSSSGWVAEMMQMHLANPARLVVQDVVGSKPLIVPFHPNACMVQHTFSNKPAPLALLRCCPF